MTPEEKIAEIGKILSEHVKEVGVIESRRVEARKPPGTSFEDEAEINDELLGWFCTTVTRIARVACPSLVVMSFRRRSWRCSPSSTMWRSGNYLTVRI